MNVNQYIRYSFEFHFFSKKSIKQVASSLSKFILKQINIPYDYNDITNKVVSSNDFIASASVYNLQYNNIGGPEMLKLTTGSLSFDEARLQLIKISRWINENGWTNDNSSLYMTLELYDKFNRIKLSNIERLKLCLNFDEKFIYKLYPNRKNNVYAKSVKNIIPNNKFIYTENLSSIISSNFKVPDDTNYAINFKDLVNNKITFKYVGGLDYERDINKLTKVFEYYGNYVLDNAMNPYFNQNDVKELNKILSKYKKISEAFISLEKFAFMFPDIYITVDLRNDLQVIKTYWGTIREYLFDVAFNGGMTKGFFNYDTDVSKAQIKNAVLLNSDLSNYEIFNSKINGSFKKCDFFDCTIEYSELLDSSINKSCFITKSYIKDTIINFNNKVEDSYIDNKSLLINGTIDRSIIKSGMISQMAVIKDTKIFK